MNKKKKMWCILVLIGICLLAHSPVYADGMGFMLRKTGIEHEVPLWPEAEQYARISYENNKQTMMLNVGFEYHEDIQKAYWLFPLPGKPEDVDIDILMDRARLSGTAVAQISNKDLNRHSEGMILSLYPFLIPNEIRKAFSALTGGMGGDSMSQDNPKVRIHKEIVKYGLLTYLVSASSISDLNDFFLNNGVRLPDDAGKHLQHYIGGGFVFIIAFVDDAKELKKHLRGKKTISSGENQTVHQGKTITDIALKASFPTDRVYFPLRPTAVYGNKVIPVHLQIDIPVKIAWIDRMWNNYQMNYYAKKVDLHNLNYSYRDVFTDVRINTAAKNYKEDLWLSPGIPLTLRMHKNIGWFFHFAMTAFTCLLTYIIFYKKMTKYKFPLWFYFLWIMLYSVPFFPLFTTPLLLLAYLGQDNNLSKFDNVFHKIIIIWGGAIILLLISDRINVYYNSQLVVVFWGYFTLCPLLTLFVNDEKLASFATLFFLVYIFSFHCSMWAIRESGVVDSTPIKYIYSSPSNYDVYDGKETIRGNYTP